MPFLDVQNIDVFYGDVQVIFDLSLTVNEGEVVSIIGGNGAGKSTLLRTISGLMQASAGKILFEGKDMVQAPPEEIVERGIVHVPEGRRLFTLMSVRDNLEVGAYNRRADGSKQETLREVYTLLPRLQERESQMAMTLSGGEQQMLALARGLMSNPKLMLLDEMSLGLAPIVIGKVYKALREIRKKGITILFVEQSVRRSLQEADRAYILEAGRVVLSGNVADLKEEAQIKKAYFGI